MFVIPLKSDVISHKASCSSATEGTFNLRRFSYTFELVISFPGKIIQALSITFFSSRTFPGQLCLVRAVIASGVKIGLTNSSKFKFDNSFSCRAGMSVLLSAREGTLIGRTFILKNKSALNSPLSTFFSKSL